MDPGNKHFIRYLEALKGSRFFTHVQVDDLKPLLAGATVEQWKPRTFHNSREVTSSFHFIVSGRLKVFQMHPITGREHTIFLLSGGDVFDVLYLMDGESHDIYWESIDGIELLSFPLEGLRRWLLATPMAQMAAFNYLAHRMRLLEETATDIALHGTLVRLSNLLLKNINGQSHKLELINNLPNEEIAGLIGTTRAVVNRHIQELKRCGAISVKRKQIDIKNLEVLMAVAEEKYAI
ncbi:Crp/Fnr family transcriptional regulator [Flagellimonas beolgyonensis]|uniref:Crp/Fnr family transcriptional regulator n=1 Tax=Flagellimonas beolgyonensis TaxID=864064 RepID=UPI003D655B33